MRFFGVVFSTHQASFNSCNLALHGNMLAGQYFSAVLRVWNVSAFFSAADVDGLRVASPRQTDSGAAGDSTQLRISSALTLRIFSTEFSGRVLYRHILYASRYAQN
jgi:hypothetical protein